MRHYRCSLHSKCYQQIKVTFSNRNVTGQKCPLFDSDDMKYGSWANLKPRNGNGEKRGVGGNNDVCLDVAVLSTCVYGF